MNDIITKIKRIFVLQREINETYECVSIMVNQMISLFMFVETNSKEQLGFSMLCL